MQREEEEEAIRESGFAQHQGFGRMEHDLTAAFCEDALTLPLTQEAARGKYRDIGLMGQLLISDIELDSFPTPVTHTLGEVAQRLRHPLAGSVIGRGDVKSTIRYEIVVCDRQSVLSQFWILSTKRSDRAAVPRQGGAVVHSFCAHKISQETLATGPSHRILRLAETRKSGFFRPWTLCKNYGRVL